MIDRTFGQRILLAVLSTLLLSGAPSAAAARDRKDAKGSGGAEAVRYKMKQKLVSIGDDFWITNAKDERAFKVNGQALRVRDTLVFEDPAGKSLCQIQAKVVTVRDKMEITGPGGETLAVVTKDLVNVARDRIVAKLQSGSELEIKGNLVDHDYKITLKGAKVAEVSKKWFRVADTYGVEVQPGQEDVLILTITAVVDMMAHP